MQDETEYWDSVLNKKIKPVFNTDSDKITIKDCCENIEFLDKGETSYLINDANQVIISEKQPDINYFGRTISSSRYTNYLLDPNLGKISLDSYAPIKRNETLRLYNRDSYLFSSFNFPFFSFLVVQLAMDVIFYFILSPAYL